jgi:ketosteroid isomerase-like protein
MRTGTGIRLAEEDARAIEAIHARWIADELAGNLTAVLDVCTEDVIWLPPGGRPLRGRQTILHWLSGPPVRIHDLRLSNLEISGDGRVAWKTCDFVTTYQPHGAAVPTIDRGSHLWVLHKGDDGVWRVVVATWTIA